MFSLVLSTCLVAAVYSAAIDVSPDVKDAPAGAHYGAGPSYNPPQFNPGPPVLDFDVNYCTIFASFPLVGLDRSHRRHSHRDRVKRQSYGVPPQQDTGNYGYQQSPPSYNPPAHGPPYFQRATPYVTQGCRNTAIFSQGSCDSCCKIASRQTGKTVAVGMLIAIDPKLIDGGKRDKDDDINVVDRALTCVCCTKKTD